MNVMQKLEIPKHKIKTTITTPSEVLSWGRCQKTQSQETVQGVNQKNQKKTIPGRSWTPPQIKKNKTKKRQKHKFLGGLGLGVGGCPKSLSGLCCFFFFWYSAFCQRTPVEMSLAIHLCRSLKKDMHLQITEN